MTGISLPLLKKAKFDFKSVEDNTTVEFVLVDRIEVLHWREVSLLVQVHSAVIASPDLVVVAMRNKSLSEDDPGMTFTSQLFVGSVTLGANTQIPHFATVPVTIPGEYDLGPMAQLVIQVIRGFSGLQALSIALSADLSLKDG